MTQGRIPERRALWPIFRAPLIVGIVSLVGLISALVGDGAWDAASWVALSPPLLLCLYYLRPGRG